MSIALITGGTKGLGKATARRLVQLGGIQTPEEGADNIVAMATIGADGPNGTFSYQGKKLAW